MAIKSQVLSALASALQTATGVTCLPRQQDAEEKVAYPYIALLPGAFHFESAQADEVDATVDGGSTLVSLGSVVGDVEIRACSKYAGQREQLEDAITRAFYGDEQSPGLLLLSIPPFAIDGATFPDNISAAVDLDGDTTWDEERVFTQPRFSSIHVDVEFSMLVAKSYPAIDTLIASITNDLTTPAAQLTDSESISVNDDGSYDPA